jgi:hypothetical protein
MEVPLGNVMVWNVIIVIITKELNGFYVRYLIDERQIRRE